MRWSDWLIVAGVVGLFRLFGWMENRERRALDCLQDQVDATCSRRRD